MTAGMGSRKARLRKVIGAGNELPNDECDMARLLNMLTSFNQKLPYISNK